MDARISWVIGNAPVPLAQNLGGHNLTAQGLTLDGHSSEEETASRTCLPSDTTPEIDNLYSASNHPCTHLICSQGPNPVQLSPEEYEELSQDLTDASNCNLSGEPNMCPGNVI